MSDTHDSGSKTSSGNALEACTEPTSSCGVGNEMAERRHQDHDGTARAECPVCHSASPVEASGCSSKGLPIEPLAAYRTASFWTNADKLLVHEASGRYEWVQREKELVGSPRWLEQLSLYVGRLVDGRAFVAEVRSRAKRARHCRVYPSLEGLVRHLWRGPGSHAGLHYVMAELGLVRLDLPAIRRVDDAVTAHAARRDGPEVPPTASDPSFDWLASTRVTRTEKPAFCTNSVRPHGYPRATFESDDFCVHWPCGWTDEDAEDLPAPPEGAKYLSAVSKDPRLHLEVREGDGSQRTVGVSSDYLASFSRHHDTVVDQCVVGETEDDRFYVCEDLADENWCARVYGNMGDLIMDLWREVEQEPMALPLLYKLGVLKIDRARLSDW